MRSARFLSLPRSNSIQSRVLDCVGSNTGLASMMSKVTQLALYLGIMGYCASTFTARQSSIYAHANCCKVHRAAAAPMYELR
jgi:hypothetical protein